MSYQTCINFVEFIRIYRDVKVCHTYIYSLATGLKKNAKKHKIFDIYICIRKVLHL